MRNAKRGRLGRNSAALLLMAAFIGGTAATCAPAPQPELPRLEANQSATVLISVGEGHGSGVIVGRSRVLTNAHVAKAGKNLVVYLVWDGRITRAEARTVAMDERHDLALLRFSGCHAQPVVIETNDDIPFPGDSVYGIGFPFDLGRSVSRGHVRISRFNGGLKAPPMARDATMLNGDWEEGSSGSGIYAVRNGHLIGLMSRSLVMGTSPFLLKSFPIIVPARHIRTFLRKNGIRYRTSE